MSGLTPTNGATGQDTRPTIRMEYCGMTGLQINKFNLLFPDGSIVETNMVVGDYWATIEPVQQLSEGAEYSVEAEGRINDNGTVKQILPGTWAFTTVVPATEYLYSEDFSGTPYSIPHTLNASQCTSQFGWGNTINADAGVCHLVNDPISNRGTVMKIDFKAGQFEWGSPGYEQGIQSRIDWPGGNKEEIYFSFELGFENSFIFNFGTHVPIVRTSGSIAAASQGTYAQLGCDWHGCNAYIRDVIGNVYFCGASDVDGQITAYTYSSDQYRRVHRSGIAYNKGTWTQIEVHLKMNSPRSSNNGEYHIYKNGIEILNDTSIQWLDDGETQGWQDVLLMFYSGGSGSQWAQPQNQSVYLNNIIISENPITHS